MYNIHSIYPAIEGEGVHIGKAQLFVRFQGCNIGCVNCDSLETWSFSPNNMLTFDQLRSEINSHLDEFQIKRISITGGDPLHPKNVPGVLKIIEHYRGFSFINIEASGQRVVDEVFDGVDFISFDIKTPSTGVQFNQKTLEKALEQYSGKMQIKAVVENRADFDWLLDLKSSVGNITVPWTITPCYTPDEEFPMERVHEIYNLNLKHGSEFQVILQQHKVIFGAKRTDV